MSEVVLIRTEGGPHPGTRHGSVDLLGGWPLPDDLPDEGGVYRKVSESQLPPMPPDSHVLRGAQYEWEPSP